MLHSLNWQSRLMAQIELEIDVIASKLSEQWKQIEEATDMLNDFATADWPFQKIASSSPCLREDLQYLLSYLMVEIMKWFEMHNKMICSAATTPMKPNVKVEKVIACCKQNLRAIANNTSKNFS